jgi:hypothetical protein
MTVNNLPLPDTLVRFLNEGQIQWMQKGKIDVYGKEFDLRDLELFPDLETIEVETAELHKRFKPGYEKEAGGLPDSLGFIPYILDFSKIVAFAPVPTGDIFCLDYRGNLQQPSVVFWHDVFWRGVAPSFDSFIDLFEPFDIDVWAERDD